MPDPSCQQLERLFAEHDIPRRHLYPWWYQVARRLGMGRKPPVLFTLAEHYRHEGSIAAGILILAILVNGYAGSTPWMAFVPLVLLVLLVPLFNWWRGRRLRRRIGL